MNVEMYNQITDDAMAIRQEVFVDEQGFCEEFDEIDKEAKHFVLFIDGQSAATCRAFYDNDKNLYMIGRVAVKKQYRKRGLGEKIINVAEEYIKSTGAEKICVSSQIRVSQFYKKLGYNEVGEVYYDEYCPHIMMQKDLK